jgi:hypothetical protein
MINTRKLVLKWMRKNTYFLYSGTVVIMFSIIFKDNQVKNGVFILQQIIKNKKIRLNKKKVQREGSLILNFKKGMLFSYLTKC